MGDLAMTLGITTYQKHIESTFMTFLENSNSSVRGVGVAKLEQMGKAFGTGWVLDIIHKIKAKLNEAEVGYSYRITVLKALAALMPKLSQEQVNEHILEVFKNSLHDKIPNVKFCVCKIIKENMKYIDPASFERDLLPRLKELSQSVDKDVAYFSTVAIPM
jgi:serine/threonine-protein phosphatase 2A regulatory subunit A